MKIKTTITDTNFIRHYREVITENKSVSHLTIIDMDMHISSAILKLGGIGGVETEESERMKGYSSTLMRDSINYMYENNFDITALFGINNYYDKFGYCVYMADPHFVYSSHKVRDIEKHS